MKSELDIKFTQEIELSFLARTNENCNQEWHHLERAHILGQFRSLRHFYVHLLMIRFGLVHRKFGEVLGQIPRIILAIPGSLTGLAPKGNTGGSSVGIFTPMKIPDVLQSVLKHSERNV